MKKILCVLCALVMMLTLTACGEQDNTEYRLNDDGQSYRLYRYAGKDGEDVVIPATYENLPVTVVGNGAFMDTKIKSVVLPEGITTIEEMAFRGCHSLESVTIPSTVTDLGRGAFSDCQKLDNIVIPAGVVDLMPGVFAACHSLKNVTLPEGLLTIGDQAFEWCYALEQITIPETVATIGMSAFTECRSLKELRLPDSLAVLHLFAITSCESLEYIYLGANTKMENLGGIGSFHQTDIGIELHDEAFALCPALKNIEVSELNEHYSSVDGVMLSKDGTELIRYPAGREQTTYTVPESVTKIANGAFNGCTLVDSSKLETVNISANVTEIAQSVFIGCNNLKTINFDGTMEQWDLAKEDTKKVTAGVVWGDSGEVDENSMITGDYGDFTIKCTDGDISGLVVSNSTGDFTPDFNITIPDNP